MISDALSSLVGLAIDLFLSAIMAVLVFLTVRHFGVPELTLSFLAFGFWLKYFTYFSIKLKERNNERTEESYSHPSY